MKQRAQSILEQSESMGWVMEPLAKELLALYGLPVTRFRWVKTEADALIACEELGFPLVAKIVSPEVVHKSDVGGIAVGLRSADDVKETFASMSALPGFDGILLDGMVSGVELIVGAKSDPQFGAVVLAGIGGTAVEVYKDVAIRMAPITAHEAVAAVRSLKGAKLLQGYRGTEPVNLNALGELIARFSEAACELEPFVESIDLNPVFSNGESSVIADARIMLKR